GTTQSTSDPRTSATVRPRYRPRGPRIRSESDTPPLRGTIGRPTNCRAHVVDSERDVHGTAESDAAPTGGARPTSTAAAASAANRTRRRVPVLPPSGMASTVGGALLVVGRLKPQPPAIAPITRDGSSPAATAAGSPVSGSSFERSS